MSEAKAKRKLVVTNQKVMAEWDNGKGGTTTLYDIEAVDENGVQVKEPLRSFAELEEGVLIQYDIEPYDHEVHGRSYTLKRPKHNTAARVKALEKQMEDLADRVSALEMDRGIEPPPAPQEEAPDQDDIPF